MLKRYFAPGGAVHDVHCGRLGREDVPIKKRRGEANFRVEIISNTVDGVRINPDRE